MTLELVVARYDEDLNWLRRAPPEFKITIYDKSSGSLPSFKFQVSSLTLPNLGHEAHTYLHHIVTRYDDLADLTVFAQGKPFDHVPDFRRTLHKIVEGNIHIFDFLWLGFIIDRDDKEGTLFKQWYPDREFPMARFWQHLFWTEMPESFVFYPGAHFAVTAKLIRSRDIAFYERALELSAESPDMAHCFERCWDKVFGVNGIPPDLEKAPPDSSGQHEQADFPIYLRPIRRLGITWDDVPKSYRPWSD